MICGFATCKNQPYYLKKDTPGPCAPHAAPSRPAGQRSSCTPAVH